MFESLSERFEQIKNRKELTTLITSSIQNSDKRAYVSNSEGILLAEFCRDYADGYGFLCLR